MFIFISSCTLEQHAQVSHPRYLTSIWSFWVCCNFHHRVMVLVLYLNIFIWKFSWFLLPSSPCSDTRYLFRVGTQSHGAYPSIWLSCERLFSCMWLHLLEELRLFDLQGSYRWWPKYLEIEGPCSQVMLLTSILHAFWCLMILFPKTLVESLS